MNISVFNSKRIPGAKRLSDLENPEMLERISSTNLHEGTDLEDALTRKWETDAHFVMYHGDDGDGGQMFARINKGPFVNELEKRGGSVVVGALVFDHDLPKLEDGSKQEWSADSLESFLGDLSEAVGTSNLEPTAWYTTLHGSRLVYVLDQAVDPQTAEAMMRGVITEFGKLGIELDPACKDWTRMFRLPNVNRVGHGTYESEVMLDMSVKLAVADCPMGEVEKANISAAIDEFSGDMPDADECRSLLEEVKNGRKYQSELYKRAKANLIGRDSYYVIFDHKPMVKGDTNWNDQVFRLTGQLVGMMAREPVATPEGLYALLSEGVQQLQDQEMRGANETNWMETVWDHIVRNWNSEQEQIEADLEEERAARAVAAEQRLTIVDKLRAVQGDIVPEGDEAAAEWLIKRSIATNGKNHYVLRSDGNYNLMPCSNSTLVPTVRDLGVQHLIPTTELRGKNVVSKTAQEIINECAIPVVEVQPSVLRDIATIEGPAGGRKLLVPIHNLNPKLRAEFDPRVDEWLQAFAGDNYELLVEWLAHSLNVRRPICALNLYGAADAGKGLLSQGLVECFESEEKNGPEVFGQWNRGLLDSPVVICDEGLPLGGMGTALTVDQAFRTLVTGGQIRIRQMNTDYFSAELFPRIMFTSNDKDLISSIVGHRDLTDEDVRAIEQRLLSMEVLPAARNLLTSKGGFAWTAGWVGVQQPSDYVLANHIFYLYTNRETPQRGSGRLLVEGEAGSRLVADEQVKSRDAEMVLRALVKLADQAHGGQNGRRMHVHEGRIWTTPNDIVEYVEENLSAPGRSLTITHARRVLGNFSAAEDVALDPDGKSTKKSTPPGSKVRKRWTEMDVPHIYQRALEFGMNIEQLERILRDQPGGGAIIDSLEAS